MIHSHSDAAVIREHGVPRSDRGLVFMSKVFDASVIVTVLMAAVTSYDIHDWNLSYTYAALGAVILFVLIGEIAGIYRPWRGETVTRQLFQILFVWIQTLFVLLLFAYAVKDTDSFSRVSTGVWVVTTPLILSGWRVIVRRIFQHIINRKEFQRNALVWGVGESGTQLAQTIERSPWLGLNLVDHLAEPQRFRRHDDPANEASSDTQRSIDRIEQRIRDGEIDILYIALPPVARSVVNELLQRLADTTVSVYIVPDYFTSSLMHGRWSNLAGIPIVSVYDTPFWGVDGWMKRFSDLALSSVLLALLAIPMALVAAAVKLTSPGPVIFKQRRYGVDGREILVWKFRTMTVCDDGDRFVQATRQDPRVTPIGALLRSTSIDELPQLINVFLGDMSIVGPRPHPVAMNEHYRGKIQGYMLRHKVRPGITGWAQVNGWRGETDTLEKITKRIEHDLWYIQNWSVWLDTKILFLTAFRGFVGRNAY